MYVCMSVWPSESAGVYIYTGRTLLYSTLLYCCTTRVLHNLMYSTLLYSTLHTVPTYLCECLVLRADVVLVYEGDILDTYTLDMHLGRSPHALWRACDVGWLSWPQAVVHMLHIRDVLHILPACAALRRVLRVEHLLSLFCTLYIYSAYYIYRYTDIRRSLDIYIILGWSGWWVNIKKYLCYDTP